MKLFNVSSGTLVVYVHSRKVEGGESGNFCQSILDRDLVFELEDMTIDPFSIHNRGSLKGCRRDPNSMETIAMVRHSDSLYKNSDIPPYGFFVKSDEEGEVSVLVNIDNVEVI